MLSNEEKAKILIVDDEKINLDVLVGLLKPEYRTVAAKNGEQALRRLESPPLPDLILLDVMMPGMDGYETCEIIKSNPKTRDIPIIFITAKTEEQDEAHGFQVGAVDYITKPFSPLIAMARVKTHLELKRRGDMLERLAGYDGLTGIPNRRKFDHVLNEEWIRAARNNRPISLVMIDIDYFKSYNDLYGHTQGDDCLRKVARAVQQSIHRPVDLAARYGGEEFACVLPDTTQEGVLTVADRIMENMKTLNIPHTGSSVSGRVTISIGAASSHTGDGTALDLVKTADKALYGAKEDGRNRVFFLEVASLSGNTDG